MIKLIRGDEDNLEGRVVVYGRFVVDKGVSDLASRLPTGTIFAMYAATNRADFLSNPFFERHGMSPESLKALDEITAEIESSVEEHSKAANIKLFQVYATHLPEFQSEKELSVGSEDLVFVGKYHSQEICVMALSKGLELYILHFEDQTRKKLGMNSFKKGDANVSPSVTYQDITGEKILHYISTTHVGPMLDAQRQDNKGEFNRLKREFVLFGLRAPFATDLFDLCGEIENNGTQPNLPLIEAYVGKISAIHSEDYAVAGKHHSKIIELKQQA